MLDMKTKKITWYIVGGTVAVTGAGLLSPVPALGIGSVLFGGCALVMALREYVQTSRQRLSQSMLEQLR
jgi:hypothetical protein